MKKILIAAAIAAAAMTAVNAQAYEVYGQVGTEGFGLGGTLPIGSMANVRGEFNGFGLSHDFNAGSIDYSGKLALTHAGIYADFFPAPTVFPIRLTAGVLIGNDHVSGSATATVGQTVTINGHTVPVSANESINARATFPHVRPYVGIGFGHTPDGNKGFHTFADIGVAFGKPHIDYTVSDDIMAAAGPANVAAEAQSFQDKANKLKVYPIVKIGLAYRF